MNILSNIHIILLTFFLTGEPHWMGKEEKAFHLGSGMGT